MKIYIEGSPLLNNRSGVGQYTKRLTEAMAKLSNDEFSVFGFRFFTKPVPKNVFEPSSGIKYRFVRFLPGRVYNLMFKLGIAPPVDVLTFSRPDIVWYPNFAVWPILRSSTKKIVTIYDLSYINYGQLSSPKNRDFLIKFVPRAIKKADKVVTISENSKREICKEYGLSPSEVSVVAPAVDPSEYFPRSAGEVSATRKKYALPSKYILFTGTLEPRKNVIGLLNAYAGLPDNLRAEYGLVLVGGKGWQDEQILSRLARLQKSGENIMQLGYVPDDDLPAIFSGASLFVYPALYEGFGMPPLEAMACGAPVITADNSSLPEVVGDAAIKIRAEDTVSLTHEVAHVLSDPALANQMVKKGLAQSKKFTWDKSAKKMLDIIKDLS